MWGSVQTLLKRKLIDIKELEGLGIPDWEIDLVARNSTEVSLTDGERIARQGALPREMFFLLEGEAAVVREGREIARIRALQAAGEMAMLENALYRNADAVARGPIKALVFTRREWLLLAEEAPNFANIVCAMAAERRAANLKE
jgi:CRP-like cAMP-binding protein